jgi:phage terminase large subunit-like protein
MIKRDWIKQYVELPLQRERSVILQSWDTANKGGPENDFSICTTWFISRDRRWYLVDVWGRRVDYPELKAAVRILAFRQPQNACSSKTPAPELRSSKRCSARSTGFSR